MSDLRKNRVDHAHVFVTCRVCETKEPLLTAEDHHRKPRAFGGTDDEENRLWLCASCHKRIHRVQSLIIHHKIQDAYELTTNLFQASSAKRARLWEYANEAAKAEHLSKEAFAEHRTHTKVSLDVEVQIWESLKLLAKGQKMSAKDLAASILRDAVTARKGEL